MNSKVLIAGISLITGTLGSIDAGAAHADQLITSGVACMPVNPANFSLLQYDTEGVSTVTSSTATVTVICPVMRKAGASSLLVVNYIFRSGGTANCTAIGTDSFGLRKGTKGFTLATGRFDMLLTDVLDPTLDDVLTVTCTLPAQHRGSLASMSTL